MQTQRQRKLKPFKDIARNRPPKHQKEFRELSAAEVDLNGLLQSKSKSLDSRLTPKIKKSRSQWRFKTVRPTRACKLT